MVELLPRRKSEAKLHQAFVTEGVSELDAESRSRRIRLDRERSDDYPVWLFSADDLAFDLTVLPATVLRQAPLSGVDERPSGVIRCASSKPAASIAVPDTSVTPGATAATRTRGASAIASIVVAASRAAFDSV